MLVICRTIIAEPVWGSPLSYLFLWPRTLYGVGFLRNRRCQSMTVIIREGVDREKYTFFTIQINKLMQFSVTFNTGQPQLNAVLSIIVTIVSISQLCRSKSNSQGCCVAVCTIFSGTVQLISEFIH